MMKTQPGIMGRIKPTTPTSKRAMPVMIRMIARQPVCGGVMGSAGSGDIPFSLAGGPKFFLVKRLNASLHLEMILLFRGAREEITVVN